MESRGYTMHRERWKEPVIVGYSGRLEVELQASVRRRAETFFLFGTKFHFTQRARFSAMLPRVKERGGRESFSGRTKLVTLWGFKFLSLTISLLCLRGATTSSTTFLHKVQPVIYSQLFNELERKSRDQRTNDE